MHMYYEMPVLVTGWLLWAYLNLWKLVFVECGFLAYSWGCNFVDVIL